MTSTTLPAINNVDKRWWWNRTMVRCFCYMEEIRLWMEVESAVFQPVTNNYSQEYSEKMLNRSPKAIQKCPKYRESSILLFPTNCYVNVVPILAFRYTYSTFPCRHVVEVLLFPLRSPLFLNNTSRSFIESLLLPCYFNFLCYLWCNKTLIYWFFITSIINFCH